MFYLKYLCLGAILTLAVIEVVGKERIAFHLVDKGYYGPTALEKITAQCADFYERERGDGKRVWMIDSWVKNEALVIELGIKDKADQNDDSSFTSSLCVYTKNTIGLPGLLHQSRYYL
jgi:hypothetical protein